MRPAAGAAQPLAPEGAKPSGYDAVDAPAGLSSGGSRLRRVLAGRGWPAFWCVTIGSMGCLSLQGYVSVSVGAQYFNHWRGDPCLGGGSGSPACRHVSRQYLSTTSRFSILYMAIYVLAAPITGALTDRLGCYVMYFFCLGLNALQFLTFVLYYARRVSFAAQQWAYSATSLVPFGIVQLMYITDLAAEPDRMQAFGFLFAVGDAEGVVFPFVASLLSERQTMVALCLIFCLVVVPATFFLLNTRAQTKQQQQSPAASGHRTWEGVREAFVLMKQPSYAFALFLFSCGSLRRTFFQANGQIILRENFGCDTHTYLAMTSVSGLLSLVVQLVLAPWLLDRVGLKNLCIFGIVASIVAQILWVLPGGLAQGYAAICVGSIVTIQGPVYNMLLIWVTTERTRGTVWGVKESLVALATAFAGYGMTSMHAYFTEPRFGMGRPLPGLPVLLTMGLDIISLAIFQRMWVHVAETHAAIQGQERRAAPATQDQA